MLSYQALCPAKINLNLFIGDKQPSGLHALASYFISLRLADSLQIEAQELAEQRSDIDFECSLSELHSAQSNLAAQAAQLWLSKTNAPYHLKIRLKKFIPTAAGLGGGSSDAATCLRSLQRLLPTYALADKELQELAFSLGSDVPYFLKAGAAAVGGEGDCLYPLPWPGKFYILLLKPRLALSTGQIFKKLAEERSKASKMINLPSPTELTQTRNLAHNDFCPLLCRDYPQIARSLDLAQELGANLAGLSGSGPTVYAIFAGRSDAYRARYIAQQAEPSLQLYLSESFSPEEIKEEEKKYNSYAR